VRLQNLTAKRFGAPKVGSQHCAPTAPYSRFGAGSQFKTDSIPDKPPQAAAGGRCHDRDHVFHFWTTSGTRIEVLPAIPLFCLRLTCQNGTKVSKTRSHYRLAAEISFGF
jgi:hypothetical protein